MPPATSVPRRRWGAALALALTLGASACGSPTPSTPGIASDAPSTAAPAGVYPVTIEHRYGSTEITEEPQRVVLVGLNEQDAMLALGKVPVATSNFLDAEGGIFPWAEAALGGAPRPVLLDQTDGIPYEKVAELTPDLIVGLYSGLTDEQYATLSKIAPVVAQPVGEKDYSIAWEDTTLTVGKILGKPTEAQKLVDDTEARFAQERSAHPEFAGRSGVAATFYEGYYFYSAEDPRGRLLGSLGFTVPADLAQFIDSDGFGGKVPGEQASVLDTDAIVWVGPDTLKTQLAADPVYSRLEVSTQRRAVFLNENDTLGKAFSFVTPLSIPFLLDGLVPQLSAAVDGDPATAAV
jgi:iron complex transport system substrate-binding protein